MSSNIVEDMPPSSKRIKIDDEINEKPSTSKGNHDDWRELAKGFKERHKYAINQGILTDVSFAVGPEETPFSAHKIILALASPVFEVMFYRSSWEKTTSDITKIPDLMPSGFQLLLDYIYTDEMELKNETDALYACFAADKYFLSHMKDICFNYLLLCELTENNVWIILENARLLNSSSMSDRCLRYLRKNIEEAINAPSFLEISEETLKMILSLDSLYVKEIRLLKCVVRWSEEKIKNGAEEPLQQFLEPFLCHIRFGCISQIDFVDFIHDHSNIISDNDALAILKYMTDSRAYSLPDWCSRNVCPRKACEKRQGISICRNLRSYVIKPLDAPGSSQSVVPCNRSYSTGERMPGRNTSGPRRNNDDDDDSIVMNFSSLSSDDEDSVPRRGRRGALNLDSDDSSSTDSSSSSSSSSGLSLSS